MFKHNSVAQVQAYSHSFLSQRLMHPSEVSSIIHIAPFKIEDKNSTSFGGTITLKTRWGVLCPTRLLLFKNKYEQTSNQLALAVYPIINSDFKIIKPQNTIAIQITFSEQAIAKDSLQKGSPVTKTLYCDSLDEAGVWWQKLQQAQQSLKAQIKSPIKPFQVQPRDSLQQRSTELSFIQKVINDFSTYFNCAGGRWCGGSDLRQSLHEIYVQTGQDDSVLRGMLTPMVFESFNTQTDFNPEQLNFEKKISLLNPFNVTSNLPDEITSNTKLTEEVTRVSLTKNSPGKEEVKVASFGGDANIQEPVRIDLQLSQQKSFRKSSRKPSLNADFSPNNIMRVDLVTLVGSIFEEEYDPKKIKRLCQAAESRPSFDFSQENLNISTGTPVRIFEALNSFIQSQNPQLNLQTQMQREDVATPRANFLPSQVSKASLLLAIHEVEDIYVAYAEDTIERVVKDLKKNRGDQSSKSGKKAVQKFDLKKNFQISVNLLVNDIQNYANLYKGFRDRHTDYFGLVDMSQLNYQSSGDLADDVYVPVSPALSSVFYQLQLIDNYRVTRSVRSLDELLTETYNQSLIKQQQEKRESRIQIENYVKSPLKQF